MIKATEQKLISDLPAQKSWAIFLGSKRDLLKAQREIDAVFSNYSFYPEIEWIQYGYRPPEGYQVLGAWRQSASKVFVFLLDNPFMFTVEPGYQMLLYISGDPLMIAELQPKLKKLKNLFDIRDRKIESDEKAHERLERLQSSKPLRLMLTSLTIITTIINAYSLYIRNMPAPNFQNEQTLAIYRYCLITIHFSALLSLFIVIVIFLVLFIKYGLVLMRKM